MTPPRELVGRERELEAIDGIVASLETGPAGVLISGDPGIGKSSLWSAVCDAAAARGALVLRARPVSAELPMGYAGLGDLLARVAPDVLPQLPAPMARGLAAALLLDDRTDDADPQVVARATLAALVALARDRPLVVAIDDVQWLDPASARALAFAMRRLGGAPITAVVALRSGQADPLALRGAFRDRFTELPLARLSLGALGRLLRAGDPSMSRRLVTQIHARSAGNPFFALHLATAPDPRRLPASIREVVDAQLAGLPAEATSAVELVAVRGPLPMPAFDDPSAVDAAVVADVLAEDGGAVRFAHPLLAEQAYDRIPPGRRRLLHRAAAAAASNVEARARHLALAADGTDASVAGIVDEAARSARARGAPEAAAELLLHAVRLTPEPAPRDRARRMMDRVDALSLAADEPAALRLVDEVLAADREAIAGVTLVRALVHRAALDVDPVSAVKRLEAAVAVEHDDVALRARAQSELAWHRGAWLGDVERAIGEAFDALAVADAAGDPSILLSALTTAGLLGSMAGDPRTKALLERAIALADEQPSAPGERSPRIVLAHERWIRGQLATAQALLEEERRRATAYGDEGLVMRVSIFEAEVLVRGGRWDEAIERLEAALGDARDWWQVLALTGEAIVAGRRGAATTRQLVDAIRDSPVTQGDPAFAGLATFAEGLIAIAEGRAADAATAMSGLVLQDATGTKGFEHAVLIPETVAVLVEAGRLDDVESLVAQLERRRPQLEPWASGAIDLADGLLLLARGTAEPALAALERAIAAFERLGTPWELGQALFAAGRALRRIGRRREAAARLEAALGVFDGLGAAPAARRTRDELARARPRARHEDALTAAERRVARRVAGGATNREVAAQLFTTVATVEAHLTRIYAKLGVRSRSELARRASDGQLAVDDAID